MKPESLKVMQELIEQASYACSDKDYVNHLVEEFARILRIEESQEKKGKFDWYKYVDQDKKTLRPTCAGVFHDKGFKIATDSHILVIRKEDYPAEYEGKILNKQGEFVDGKYPAYRAVIPDLEKTNCKYSEHRINFAVAREFYATQKALCKVDPGEHDIKQVFVAVGEACAFRVDYFMKLCDAMQAIGTEMLWVGHKEDTTLVWDDKLKRSIEDKRLSPRVAMAKNGEDIVIMMPVGIPANDVKVSPILRLP